MFSFLRNTLLAFAMFHTTGANIKDCSYPNSLFDFTDDDTREGWRNGLELFDFQTSHGQGISQLLGRDGRVTKFAQPRFRKLHEYALRRSLKLA
jgi:hypothetical protein